MGGEILRTWHTERGEHTVLHILSATDSCKDRLAAYFHWNDRAALSQALAVARSVHDRVDFANLEAWAEGEGESRKYADFVRRLG